MSELTFPHHWISSSLIWIALQSANCHSASVLPESEQSDVWGHQPGVSLSLFPAIVLGQCYFCAKHSFIPQKLPEQNQNWIANIRCLQSRRVPCRCCLGLYWSWVQVCTELPVSWTTRMSSPPLPGDSESPQSPGICSALHCLSRSKNISFEDVKLDTVFEHIEHPGLCKEQLSLEFRLQFGNWNHIQDY